MTEKTDEFMTVEYLNGKWEALNETLLLLETTFFKDSELATDPLICKFYWEIRRNKERISSLMIRKRKDLERIKS